MESELVEPSELDEPTAGGPEAPDADDAGATAGGGHATPYQRSTVRFPYSALRDAEQIAQELHDRWGGTTTLHQLAGGMGTSARGGTFRVKVGTGRTFGVVAPADKGSLTLTDLGRKLLDPQTRAAARVEAFLGVPLFAQLVDAYKGSLLPPSSGLDQKISALGVSTKQASRARAAFLQSADEAGFFKISKERLVQPANLPNSGEREPNPTNGDHAEKGAGGTGGNEMSQSSTSTPALPNLPAPLPELWLTLLRDGRSWSAEKTQEFVAAARKLQDLLAKS